MRARACVRACEHADVFGGGARSSCVRVARGPLAVHGVQKLMSNVQEAFAPAPGKVKPWENIAPTYPLMKLVRPSAVPRASLALPATARRSLALPATARASLALPATAQQSLALSARQVEAAFTYLGKQTKQFAMAKPPQAILGAVLFECVEMYAPLPSLSTPWYSLVLLSTPWYSWYSLVLLGTP